MSSETREPEALAMKNAMQRLFNEAVEKRTQEDIARASGLSKNNIKDWMSGRREPRLRHYFAFAEALGFTRRDAFRVLGEVTLEQQ